MKFDFPFKKKKKEKWTESLDRVTQILEDTRELYAHCISSNTKRKTNEGNSSWLNYLCCITILRA